MRVKKVKPNSDISPSAAELIKLGYFTREQFNQKVAYFGGKCWLCKWRSIQAIDHVIPRSYKPIHFLANIRPVCKSCNSAKNGAYPFDMRMLRVKLSRPELSDTEKLVEMAKIALRHCETKKIHHKPDGTIGKSLKGKPDIIVYDTRILANKVLEVLGR